jgi:hypothetical protein
VDENGQVSGGVLVEVTIIEEELAADWHAVDRYMARRHRDNWYSKTEMIGGPGAEGEGAPAELPSDVSDETLWSVLERARARAGLQLNVIEARSFDVPDGPAELAVATANASEEDRG